MEGAIKHPSGLGGGAPNLYRNWWYSGTKKQGMLEFPVWTDVRVSGAIKLSGPFTIVNLVPLGHASGRLVEALLLRVDWYLQQDTSALMRGKTIDDAYHGGSIQDELAALLSLKFGRRFRSADCTRLFSESDPYGEVSGYYPPIRPIMETQWSHRGRIIPEAFGDVQISGWPKLEQYPLLSEFDVVALMKAARQYQAALWLAETDANMCWLLLISAIETAAHHWSAETIGHEQRLRDSHLGKDIIELLKKHNAIEAFPKLAELLKEAHGAVKEFREFIFTFLLNPPLRRPVQAFQVSWEKKDLKKDLDKIYTFRSDFVHGAKPFPAPLTRPPLPSSDRIPSERPAGIASGFDSHVWIVRDLPMYLHTFEHIVRGCLLNWWDSLKPFYSADDLAGFQGNSQSTEGGSECQGQEKR